MTLPPAPLHLIRLLETAGFSAYVVGGCVRDALLGQCPGDWDLSTSAQPEQACAVLRAAGVTVHETGLQHGTITAAIDHKPYEITTFRLDSAYTDHRRPDAVEFTDDLRADLSRRDFTVNAMAFHPARGLADPFHGQQDLRDKTIRCVGEPALRFGEDALRILRGLRFASTLGFAIESKTAEAILVSRETILHVAAERIQAELTKLLCGQNTRRVLLDYREVIFTALPQLRALSGFDQRTPWHCYDIWEHSCAAVEAVPPSPALRWAALLHDSGKPECFFMRGGTGHFHGHPQRSERVAREICDQLKFSRRLKERVLTLVANHELRLLDEAPNPVRLRRLLGKFGKEVLLELIDLMRADACAQAPEKRAFRLENYEPMRRAVRALVQQNSCVARKQLAVTGRDLIPLGLQGPRLGQALDRLLEEVLEGRLPNEREALLRWAQQNNFLDNSTKI